MASASSIQAQLEPLYSPPLDSALVAAIASDPGQTLQGAREVLDALVGDVGESEDAATSAKRSPPTRALEQLQLHTDTHPSSTEGSSATSTSNGKRTPSSTLTSPEGNDGDHLGGARSDSDHDAVERLLDEFRLAERLDKRHGQTQPLQLTDDEGHDGDGDGDEDEDEDNDGHSSSPRIDDDEDEDHLVRPTEEHPSILTSASSADPLLFLMHAFPTRTRSFLAETLHDCRDDVSVCIDTLMAIDLVEREEMDATLEREASQQTKTPAKHKGLDYEQLAEGTAASSSSTTTTAAHRYKGKRGRAMRKKAHQEYLRSIGQADGSAGREREQPTRVVMGDVRQGGNATSMSNHNHHRKAPARSTPAPPPATPLTDAELAQQLAEEEEERTRDPNAGQAVRDNQWLLTSSVLAQLAQLLALPPDAATSAYNKAGFNLHVAVGRLVDASASVYPTVESLEVGRSDGDGDAPVPPGTSHALAASLAALSGKPPSAAQLALRATHGRQDAALDLLSLLDVVRDAAAGAKPDTLDPLGVLRGSLGEDARSASASASAASDRKGLSVSTRSGNDADAAARLARDERTASQGGFSAAAGRGRNAAGVRAPPVGQDVALASLRSGAAGVSLPPSAAAATPGVPLALPARVTAGLSSASASASAAAGAAPSPSPYAALSHVQREDLIAHFHALAAEYRARRDRCLVQASRTWRTSPQNTNNRGAAFYYADEARALDAKARACNLRAAQCLVENRRRACGGACGGTGAGTAARGAGRGAGGVIDLHGLTVREALSIVSEELARCGGGGGGTAGSAAGSLTIVTGAGRHSAGGVPVLTPSVAKYLEREGWRADVDRARGVIVVRGGR